MIIKQNEMVSKNDLKNEFKINFKDMQTKITADAKIMVATAVDPIRNKIYDISARLEKVEKNGP